MGQNRPVENTDSGRDDQPRRRTVYLNDHEFVTDGTKPWWCVHCARIEDTLDPVLTLHCSRNR